MKFLPAIRSLVLPALVIGASMTSVAWAVAPKPPITTAAPSAPAPVTKDDLISAGAKCSGTACTFKGALWDCSNPKACTIVKTN